ncbi:MAG: hypothetical protein ABSF83_06680 [Nitrososphaerales archaeon]
MSRGGGARRPPKGWRRNMAASALLLLLLEVIIISPAPSVPRLELGLLVGVLVLAAIAAIWRRNALLERSS